ncbi:MAG: class I SAM-dependent methyltransferase [Chloroflexota bacterium]
MSGVGEWRASGCQVTAARRELNGDRPLSARERRHYLTAGLRELAAHLRSRAEARPFELDPAHPATSQIVGLGASAFRVYTSGISRAMARRYVHAGTTVLDLGCGSGAHARFFEGLARNVTYIGVDVARRDQWANQRSQTESTTESTTDLAVSFVQASAVDLGIRSGSIGYSFSSSALEHIGDIDHAGAEIARVMAPGSYGVHVVPGVWALPLYMFHGYRRFSPAGLRAFFQGAGLEVREMWSLGGAASFVLHFLWIACLETTLTYEWAAFPGVPAIMRRILPPLGRQARRGLLLGVYRRLLHAALLVDKRLPLLPAGYAVVIHKPVRGSAGER